MTIKMKELILGLCITGLAAAQSVAAASEREFSQRLTERTIVTAEHIVGPCHFNIANMFGGEFRVPYPDSSPPQQGSYYLPITGPLAFSAGGFGLFCVDATDERITLALNAKYVDGRWLTYGPVKGPEFIPFERRANARTVSLKGRNWTGIAYTEDDPTGDEKRRARVFHFCLIRSPQALCGHTPVKWLADRKTRSDLERIKAILESVEFVDFPSKNPELSSQLAKPIEREIAKQCGATFSVPSGINVMLVQGHRTESSERCTLALTRTGRPHAPAERGVADGYYEEADLVLVVKAEPATDRLVEFNFAPPIGPGESVRYIGQPLTETAKRIGYSGEKVNELSVTRKSDGVLYTADALADQKGLDGSRQPRRRLDILWGNNNDVSVGATVWCMASKPGDCDFQKQVRALFGTLSTLGAQ
ncbi:hypothetical protein [Cupriavidus campinensis]